MRYSTSFKVIGKWFSKKMYKSLHCLCLKTTKTGSVVRGLTAKVPTQNSVDKRAPELICFLGSHRCSFFCCAVDIFNNLHKEFGKTVSALVLWLAIVHACTYIYTCMHTQPYMYVYTHSCVLTHPHMRAHTQMHTHIPTQCVQRTLDQLVAEGKLKEKVYGKQKVYVANQVC